MQQNEEYKRIIKFRGIPIVGSQFVYGNLVHAADGVFIIEEGTRMRFEEPEFHKSGMGCGLEDRGIRDRYEAMQYGFDSAVEKCAELHADFAEVDPATVGQFTGFPDKNGKDIYEGDIIEPDPGHVTCNCEVVFEEPGWKLKTIPHDQTHLLREEVWRQSKVIGNIYETPELLRV